MSRRFQGEKRSEPEKKEQQLGAGSIIFFYTVAACLMFFLGVLVGRGTLPFQYDIPNIELKLQEMFAGLEKETARENETLGFYEELKDEDKRVPSEHSPRKILARSSSEKKQLSEKVEAIPEPSPISGQKSTATASPEKTGSAEVKPAKMTKPSERWTIQVAAFRNPEEAALNVKKFREKGYDAYAVEARMESGAVWYRFRVGKFTDRETAAAVRDKLARDGSRNAFILQDD